MHRIISRACLCWVGALLLNAPPLTAAEEVVVVGEEENIIHRRFLDGFEQQLNASGGGLSLQYIPRDKIANRNAEISAASLIVTVGALAARDVREQGVAVPTINALVNRDEQTELPNTPENGAEVSSLYIEQPPLRMALLVRAALPAVNTVTIAVGEDSQRFGEEIKKACHRVRLACETFLMRDSKEIDTALEQAVHAGRVLMVLPDPLVIKASTAKTLILGAYLRGISLIGYSQALVKAGALMAVHSTPEQLGMDAAMMVLESLVKLPVRLPASRYPGLFSVSVNYQLARALRLDLRSEVTLEEIIKRAERNE